MKNFKKIAVILFTITLTFIVTKKILSNNYSTIRTGITKKAATAEILKSPTHFFIVQPELWTTSRGWKITSINKNRSEDVELVSNSPANAFPSMVLLNEANSFLVEGNLNATGTVLTVKNWEFIIPIKRDYDHPAQGQKSRWFYPGKYVDQFDVDNGDYKP